MTLFTAERESVPLNGKDDYYKVKNSWGATWGLNVAVTIPGTGPAHSILAMCSLEGFVAWHQIEYEYDGPTILSV